MWLSLIWTKLKPPWAVVSSAEPVAAKSFEAGTPPTMVQSRPVPAQAMQLRKPRRSIPSWFSGAGADSLRVWLSGECCGRVCFTNSSSTVGNGDSGKLFPTGGGIFGGCGCSLQQEDHGAASVAAEESRGRGGRALVCRSGVALAAL